MSVEEIKGILDPWYSSLEDPEESPGAQL